MLKKHFIAALAVILLFMAVATLSVGAAGKTVVYLADGGKGDGSSAASPLGSLTDAYDALDLTKDCTVVLCGTYTQNENFVYGKSYTGSVTLTSVYGGKDYRKSGAMFAFAPSRFVLFGETTFEKMDFKALGTNLLVVAQHNKVTIGEGVTVSGDKLTGTTVAKSFCILGGYQSGQSNPPAASDANTDITVLSGNKIYIVAFSRSLKGEYTGTAHIKIGGNAEVTTLHLTAAYPDGVKVGKTEVEITGNARVDTIYGATQNTVTDGFHIAWRAGRIGKYEPVSAATPGKRLHVTGATVLSATDQVKASASYAAIAAQFDRVEDLGGGIAEKKVGTRTTVYLADGGKGDGSSAASPLGSLTDAYDALDLTKDCTIVLCGTYTQSESFVYGKNYSGSVTLTSVYGDNDYRKSGATYVFAPPALSCSGKRPLRRWTSRHSARIFWSWHSTTR